MIEGMRRLACALVLIPAALVGAERHFDLLATFEPGAAGEEGAVEVTFRALDPDLRLNEEPAPRLRLELDETVLVDRQDPPPRSIPAYDPLTAQYLDLSEPVRFPVAVAPTAPSGVQAVKAKVVYFYCSVREAWCRRGIAPIDFVVTVP